MKNNMAIVALFLIFSVTLNACAPQAVSALASNATPVNTEPAAPQVEATPPPAIFATMSEITGTVQVKLTGQDSFLPADPNTLLVENSQIETGDDGRVRLDLSSGTIMRVPPSTNFILKSNTPTDDGLLTRIQLVIGKLFIILNGGSLEVETPSGVASVRGSYMSVEYYPETGRVRITCLEGHCSLADSDEIAEITAGQTAEIVGFGITPTLGYMSQQDIQTWLDNSPEAQLIIPTPTDTETPIPPMFYVPPIYVAPTIEESSEEIFEETPPATEPPPTAPPLLTPTVLLSTSPSVSALVGENILFTVSVLPPSGGPVPTGTIIVVYGPYVCNLLLDSAGNASCSGALFTTGNYAFYASYSGDANYASAQSASVSYSIIGGSTTTSLNNPIGPSTVNEPVSFTATVTAASGTPTGSVTFSDGVDSCTAASAPWTCSIAFTSAGSKTVTASYNGDGTFTPSTSNSVSQIVNPYTTTLSYVHVAAPAEVDFVAPGDLDLQLGFNVGSWTVLTYPTGTVTITEPISGNSCNAVYNSTYQEWRCTLIGAEGKYVEVFYSGDSNFNGFTITSYSLFFLY